MLANNYLQTILLSSCSCLVRSWNKIYCFWSKFNEYHETHVELGTMATKTQAIKKTKVIVATNESKKKQKEAKDAMEVSPKEDTLDLKPHDHLNVGLVSSNIVVFLFHFWFLFLIADLLDRWLSKILMPNIRSPKQLNHCWNMYTEKMIRKLNCSKTMTSSHSLSL